MTFKHELVQLKELNTKSSDKGRFYETPEGQSYPSVTTITGLLSKASILAWRQRVGDSKADAITKAATTRGNKVHKMAEMYLRNEMASQINLFEDPMPHIEDMFFQLTELLDNSIGIINAIEAPLYSDQLKVGGRVDVIAEWDGELAVIDFKTSSKPKKESWIDGYFMQSSAYALMFEELTGIKINKIVIAIAVENNRSQVFIKDSTEYLQQFIDLRKTYDIMN
ncbi:MAG: PD-(D/E)XK nuclease family protein [Gammaproteobacteria bacterium]|jgi:genome maintenance exonuclease 1|nr:PD-(D/E)XK nuclease family protein [Gammaproteobacteria bacterium]